MSGGPISAGSASAAPDAELALFPLQAVLFPGGLLSLRVVEPRYLDLVRRCLRAGRPFGAVAIRSPAGDVAPGATAPDAARRFEDHGVYAEVLDAQPRDDGALAVRCRGGRRFILGDRRRGDDGLWFGQARALHDDRPTPPEVAQFGSVRGLANAIARMKQQGSRPFLEPYRFDDAGWVANRWCEILPIPLSAKQQLMTLPDPRQRLELVDRFLRGQGVLS